MNSTENRNGADYGLDKPVYTAKELIDKRVAGCRTHFYEEVKNGALKITKRGRSTVVLLPHLVEYLNTLRGGNHA